MSFVESLRALVATSAPLPAPTQAWSCQDRGQVLAAAFELHELAMKVGLMPDEATTLCVTLAELGAQAVREAQGVVASVVFSPAGWRLEVTRGAAAVLVSEYERVENG